MRIKTKIYLIRLLVIMAMVSILGCSYKPPEEPDTENYVYTIPEVVENDLDVGNINEVGIDQEKITSFFNRHLNGQFEYLHSLLIMRNNKLVVEEYFSGKKYRPESPITWETDTVTFDRTIQHYMASVTKSFVSAIIGVCIDNELIKNIDQPIEQFFPEYKHLFDEKKSKITIKHLLGMKSGIAWRTDEVHDSTLMINSDRPWVEYVLSRPMDSEPGTKWQYNDGISVILADIVSRVSGIRADIYAKDKLLDPLGISTDTYWVVNEFDEIGGGWGLFMLPRDMVKFGKLFLQKGIWNGVELISQSWVERSWTVQDVPYPGTELKYACHWWTFDYKVNNNTYRSLEASGAGGQHIIIIPELDMVVVFTMGDYDRESLDARAQMLNYIIPACI